LSCAHYVLMATVQRVYKSISEWIKIVVSILIHHYDSQWIFYVHAFTFNPFFNPFGCHSSIFELHPSISYYICIMIHNIVYSIYFGINENHPKSGQLSSMFVIYFDLLSRAQSMKVHSQRQSSWLQSFKWKNALYSWHSYI